MKEGERKELSFRDSALLRRDPSQSQVFIKFLIWKRFRVHPLLLVMPSSFFETLWLRMFLADIASEPWALHVRTSEENRNVANKMNEGNPGEFSPSTECHRDELWRVLIKHESLIIYEIFKRISLAFPYFCTFKIPWHFLLAINCVESYTKKEDEKKLERLE